DPVAALTAVLPGEPGSARGPANNAELSGFRPAPPDNTLPRTVALTGSAAAVVALGMILVVVQILKRHQGRRPG
ncbi:MAG: type VII secretion-associated serine protease, partial [Pseudonocardiales bacterium]|nr:type VII secretion-associated serine protease [Pseudonocardiales bacterium]